MSTANVNLIYSTCTGQCSL